MTTFVGKTRNFTSYYFGDTSGIFEQLEHMIKYLGVQPILERFDEMLYSSREGRAREWVELESG